MAKKQTDRVDEKNPGIEEAYSFAEAYPRIYAALSKFDLSIKAMPKYYPRLMAAVESGWGATDGLAYLNNLLLSDRNDRQGFSLEQVDELTLLKNVFEVNFPKVAINPHDPFSNVRAAEIQEKMKALSALGKKNKAQAKGAGGPEPERKVRVRGPEIRPDEVGTIAALQLALSELEKNGGPAGKEKRLIGEYLIEDKVLDEATLNRTLEYQSKAPVRHRIGEFLISDGAVTAPQLNRALARQRGIPLVDASLIEISTEAVRLVPIRIARLKEAMPITMHDRRLVVAVSDPFDLELQEYFSFLSGTRTMLVYSSPEKIAAAQANYGHATAGAGRGAERKEASGGEASPDSRGLMRAKAVAQFEDIADELGDDEDAAGDALGGVDENDETVIGLVNKVINDAIRLGVSDIHFEAFPRTRNAQIRFRKDGVMEAHSEYPVAYHPAVVSRLKIIAELDISEKRKSQDGKIAFGQGNKKLDLRVSTIPTSNALEVVTVRILSSGKPMPLSRIGMHPAALEAFRDQILKPYGLILVCGPTGSGKTTTLHSVLRELNTPERKIWTAEDPVEVVQKNISQVQVLPKIGWTFANALRSFLRADPDVIMIGEIRDAETAKVAVEASMTGHLVMSTVHTNSAAETLARMLDLDVAAFNLADAALAVLAQRLARRVCADCGEAYEFNDEELETLVNEYHLAGTGKAPSKTERDRLLARWRSEFFGGAALTGVRAVGCSSCNGSGYRGRLGIHELLVVTPEIRKLIRGNASTGEVFRQAIGDGMKTLRQDGIEKVVQGLTDLKEVRTVCM